MTMDDYKKELISYRMRDAFEMLGVAKMLAGASMGIGKNV